MMTLNIQYVISLLSCCIVWFPPSISSQSNCPQTVTASSPTELCSIVSNTTCTPTSLVSITYDALTPLSSTFINCVIRRSVKLTCTEASAQLICPDTSQAIIDPTADSYNFADAVGEHCFEIGQPNAALSVSILNCKFAGAALVVHACPNCNVVLENVDIEGNSTTSRMIVLYNLLSFRIQSSNLNNSNAQGMFSKNVANVVMVDTHFRNCNAPVAYGGCMHLQDENTITRAVVSRSTFQNCSIRSLTSEVSGGCVFVSTRYAELTDVNMSDCSSNSGGGGGCFASDLQPTSMMIMKGGLIQNCKTEIGMAAGINVALYDDSTFVANSINIMRCESPAWRAGGGATVAIEGRNVTILISDFTIDGAMGALKSCMSVKQTQKLPIRRLSLWNVQLLHCGTKVDDPQSKNMTIRRFQISNKFFKGVTLYDSSMLTYSRTVSHTHSATNRFARHDNNTNNNVTNTTRQSSNKTLRYTTKHNALSGVLEGVSYGTVAMDVSRNTLASTSVMLSFALETCPSDSDGGNEEEEDVTEDDISIFVHPTRVRIQNSLHTGCIIMNSVLLIVIFPIICGFQLMRKRKKKLPVNPSETRLMQLCVAANQPTKSLWWVWLCAESVTLVAAYIIMHAHADNEDGGGGTSAVFRASFGLFALIVIGGLPVWISLSTALLLRDPQEWDKSHIVYGSLYYDKIVVGKPWEGILMKPVCHVVLCLVGNYPIRDEKECKSIRIVGLCIYSLTSIVIAARRPYKDAMDNITESALDGLAALAIIMTLLQVELGVAVIVFIISGINLMMNARTWFNKIRRCFDAVKKKRGEKRNHEKKEEDGTELMDTLHVNVSPPQKEKPTNLAPPKSVLSSRKPTKVTTIDTE
eukprot:PhF_6_TR36163/c0_g1_i1/m.52604